MGATVTVTDALAVPPGPVQARENALELANDPVDWPILSESALPPDHAPEARQEVASVDDQVSVEDPPFAIDVGFAAIDTMGTGDGGGVLDTMTVADALAVPPAPVQERENVLELVNGPVDWPELSESALPPDHAPEARQEVASVDDQVSVEDPPLATDMGFAAIETVGIGRGVTTIVAEAVAPPPEPVQVRE